jgi:glycosyltransferase involved in cell wall biosynthesis
VTGRFGLREIFPTEYWFNLKGVINNYDVVHFHDLYSAVSPLTLALTARKKLTFFTVHDCSVFTGGCLYPAGCEKFISHCHNCPQLPQIRWRDKIRDRTREVQSIKRWLSKNNMIRYIFPSQWIANQASLSLSFKVPPVIIPNGIDLDFFSNLNKKQARDMLSISEHRKVVIISANYLAAPHKGVRYAINALQTCRDFAPLVIAVGHCNHEIRDALQGLDVMEVGFIDDANEMAKIYAASDIMMFCSLEDNLPLTVLEAMAASTVIVGFATGGVPEMIQSGQNGILVEPANQEALNESLREVLSSPILGKIGQQARKDAENNFSKRIFLEKHIQLYQSSLLY